MSLKLSHRLKAGELLFKEGDMGDCAYIIETGRIEVFVERSNGEQQVSILTAGELVGEMAIVDKSPRSASARAIEDTELVIVSREQLGERIQLSDPVVRLLVKMLMSRLRKNLNLNSGNFEEEADFTGMFRMENESSEETNGNVVQMVDSKNIVERIKFEREMEQAIDDSEFSLHFQPIIDFQTSETVGFEALCRWNSPRYGFVRPDIFISIAEDTSLIIPLGQWILDNACENFRKILDSYTERKQEAPNFFMSINVSTRQLNDPKFFEILDQCILKHGINPNQLKLEITESVLLHGSNIHTWIEECRDRGVSIALDDFGTGYSSLSYLSGLTVDNIKIDRSFIQKMLVDHATQVIIKGVLDIAKGINIPLIAEGIETAEQSAALKALGCEYGQGYLFGKPQTISDLILYLHPDEKNTKSNEVA